MARWVPNRPVIRATPIEAARPLVSKVCRQVEGGAKRLVQVKTGRLKTSIGTRISSGASGVVTGRVGSRVRHALVAHEGARPHPIYPSKQKALRFFWERVGTQVIFAKVNHPGMKGSQYLMRPLFTFATAAGFRVVVTSGRPLIGDL
jgi:hypothetical protein